MEHRGLVRFKNMIAQLQLGIDTSKPWFDVFVRARKKDHSKRFDNNQKGHEEFIRWASEFGARKLHVGIESTGNYHLDLALACYRAGFKVSILDGGKIATYRNSFGRAKPKTDKADARLIARYLKERRPALWSPRPDEYQELTELVRHRQDIIESINAWASRSAQSTQSERVAAERNTLLSVHQAMLEDLEKQIQEHIKAHARLQQDVQLLQSIDGIACKSAVRILAEMGPVSRYRTPRDLAFAAGLTPRSDQSGTSRNKTGLPVYGNRQLRNALYLPVIVAMRIKRGVAHFTDRIDKRGNKAKKTVITAGMRKLAHLIHGILKSREPFDEQRFLYDMRQRA